MLSIDNLVIQNLLPKDSGVYHCVVMITPEQPVITAVYSLVVGENWIHVFSGGELRLDCNSKELGMLFKNATRTWSHRLGKETAPALKDESLLHHIDARYNGTWTCIVKDRRTRRTWLTARYKVIVDPPPPFLIKIKIRMMENKVASFGIVMGIIFFCMVIYQALVEKLQKRGEKYKEEMEFFKTALKTDMSVPGPTEDENRPLL